ncbi:hypothetical protein HMPREF1986_00567 [Oribacterium sp. oral taxon 078 str. F0263]|nr:hypothetical protein HMPREF1986_00567 [Oribacterium sp. oral taxon 078 str. F0263]
MKYGGSSCSSSLSLPPFLPTARLNAKCFRSDFRRLLKNAKHRSMPMT